MMPLRYFDYWLKLDGNLIIITIESKVVKNKQLLFPLNYVALKLKKSGPFRGVINAYYPSAAFANSILDVYMPVTAPCKHCLLGPVRQKT
jgi:hypothetical protein